jgi:anti-sigma factor RsiW
MVGEVMNCKEMHEWMPDLATGLDKASPEIGEHLSTCPACATKLEEMRQTMALLDEWQAPEPSAYFDTRLMARLREEQARPALGWLQWIRKPALALSLTVLMAFGVTFVTVEHRGLLSGTEGTPFHANAEPGTAVGDLQALDKNHDMYADFDLLDDLQVQSNVNANP